LEQVVLELLVMVLTLIKEQTLYLIQLQHLQVELELTILLAVQVVLAVVLDMRVVMVGVPQHKATLAVLLVMEMLVEQILVLAVAHRIHQQVVVEQVELAEMQSKVQAVLVV
jgi:hypothetical protein